MSIFWWNVPLNFASGTQIGQRTSLSIPDRESTFKKTNPELWTKIRLQMQLYVKSCLEAGNRMEGVDVTDA